MNNSSYTPGSNIAQDGTSQQEHQRFARLRALIQDKNWRQRFLFLTSLIALMIVLALATLARLSQVWWLDVAVTHEFQEEPRVWLQMAMSVISMIGYTPWSTITVASGTLLIGLLVGWKDGAYLLLITVLQGLINAGIKLAIGRPRPLASVVDVFVPTQGASFPSGHVMFYTVFFGFLLFLIWMRCQIVILRWIGIVLTGGLVLLVGPSRILLGAHWLTDVVAAYLLGFIILAFAIEWYLSAIASGRIVQKG